MVNTQDTRKDFAEWKVEAVYKAQDGVCTKCGCSLARGFERHHKDGNHENNETTNLELMCPRCHGTEAYGTYVKQKTKALENLDNLMKTAMEGKMAGALVDKLVDGIKLGLGLTEELYHYGIEKPPAALRMEQYMVSAGLLEKEYERGLHDGIIKGMDIVTQSIRDQKEYRE